MSHEGPDVWVHIAVPEGVHRLGFYFFNKDGHRGPDRNRGLNRYRDYLLELRPARPLPVYPLQPVAGRLARLDAAPVLARGRVREFWGGAHHRFAVRGPGHYQVKIACNDSYNTIVSGVFLDRLTGPPTYQERSYHFVAGGGSFNPPPAPWSRTPDALTAFLQEYDLLEEPDELPPGAVRPLLLLARRTAASLVPLPPAVSDRLRWRAFAWDDEARAGFDAACAASRAARRPFLTADASPPPPPSKAAR